MVQISKISSLGVTLATVAALTACSENRAQKTPAAGAKGDSAGLTAQVKKDEVAPVGVSALSEVLAGVKNPDGKPAFTEQEASRAAADALRGGKTDGRLLVESLGDMLALKDTDGKTQLLTGKVALEHSKKLSSVDCSRAHAKRAVSMYPVVAALQRDGKPAFTSQDAIASSVGLASAKVDAAAFTVTFDSLAKAQGKTQAGAAVQLETAEVLKIASAVAKVPFYTYEEASKVIKALAGNLNGVADRAALLTAIQYSIDVSDKINAEGVLVTKVLGATE